MKKKTLGRIFGICLAAALTVTSVPVPVMAAEDTNATEVAVDTVDVGSAVSDNDSPEGEADDTSAEEETGEAAGDDETEAEGEYWESENFDLWELDAMTVDNETLDRYLLSNASGTIASWITSLSDKDIDKLLQGDNILTQTLDYYGEDIDSAYGLVNAAHFERGIDYYKAIAACNQGKVKAGYTQSTGYFYVAFPNGTSRIKITGVKTGVELTTRQKNLAYEVSNAKYGLRLNSDIKSSYTWAVSTTDQDYTNNMAEKDKGTLSYNCGNQIFNFDKPAGYIFDVTYSNYANVNSTARRVLYMTKVKGDKGVIMVADPLKSTTYAAETMQFRTSFNLINTGLKAASDDKFYHMTATLNFTPAIYYVAYNANGGSGVDTQKCTYGTTYTYAAAPKTAPHYTLNVNLNGAPGTASAISASRAFVNWSDVNPGQQFSNLTTTNGATITKVANWGNGTCTLPAAPSRTGYHFGGWNTAQGVKGAGTAYTATKDETITAVWNAQGYNVKFISDGKEYGSQSFVYGTAQGLRSLADLKISKPGYVFKGWNGTYTDGQAVKDLTDINNGTVTLTAQWEAKTDTPYTVHRYVQKSLDSTDPSTGYELYTAPEGTENPILGTETKTATTDTSVTEIAVAIPGYDTPDAIGPKTIAGDGSTTFDFYYNLTDTRATLTVNHYYQTSIDGDWVLYNGTFGSRTDTTFTNVFHGTIGESMTPEQLSPKAIENYEIAYSGEYTLVPTESPKTVVLTKNSEVNYYYKMVKKNTTVEYKVEHYIQKSEGGAYELFYTDVNTAELGSTVTPALNQKAIDTVNAIEGCKCEKPQLQVVTITKEGMVFSYKYACVKGTPDVISDGGNLSQETINEIAKRLAAGLSFKMDIEGVNYEIVQNPDGTLGIKFAVTDATKVVIPDIIKIGEKVYRITEVHDRAFYDNTSLKEVVISKNISKIGNSAFEGCINLKKVTLQEGLVTIGNKAFKDCSALTSITLPSTVQKIGAYAFENCVKMTSVTLNEGLLKIGKKAFYNCKKLKKIKIPKSVLKMDSYVFGKCTALATVTFAPEANLLSMGAGAFSNCTALKKIKLPDKLTAIPSKCFKGDKKLASVTIGKSVTKINAEAFSGCKKLKKVTIPSKVQTIGKKAFYNCKNLKNVSIKSKALTSVGSQAFKKCKKGIKITVPNGKADSYKKLMKGKY